ncbi:hypothetical protein GIB67_039437 [Kingdonia uniflora]|uniref:Uncharacterized protein n=1 Tax=Kingdonia uniflora TaxID=39325 RepID=A0A7J7LIK8_9MAGN|nr:hypothetical protein GIB67_039437 [Kingdonia uniflora]
MLRGKMKLIDEDDPITISGNGEDEYLLPEKGETILRHIPFPRHSYDLRHVFINYGGKWGKMSPTDKINDHHGVGNYIPEGNVIEVKSLYNGLPFVVRCTDDLRDITHSSDDDDYVSTAEDLKRGKPEAQNTLYNAAWVARKVESLVRDIRAITPKTIKARMKTKYGVEINYWTTWNARQICMESIIGSYAQGYHDLPSLYVEILKSNPGSIAKNLRQDDTLQWTSTLIAFKASLNGFVKGHMLKNIKKYYKGAHLERLSWGAARAFRHNEEQEFLNQLGIDIPGANDYLEKEPYEH